MLADSRGEGGWVSRGGGRRVGGSCGQSGPEHGHSHTLYLCAVRIARWLQGPVVEAAARPKPAADRAEREEKGGPREDFYETNPIWKSHNSLYWRWLWHNILPMPYAGLASWPTCREKPAGGSTILQPALRSRRGKSETGGCDASFGSFRRVRGVRRVLGASRFLGIWWHSFPSCAFRAMHGLETCATTEGCSRALPGNREAPSRALALDESRS
jgi:hypothetical protein